MRSLGRRALGEALQQSRQYTKALTDDLSDAQWGVPKLATVNPVLWEVGHMGWFMERWCLRHTGAVAAPSRLPEADCWYDSSGIAHADRWRVPLPGRAATLRYVEEVLEATLDRLEQAGESDEELYVFRLALYHEDMHAESFAHTRQTLGYAAPRAGVWAAQPPPAGEGDACFDGGEFEQGARRNAPGFVFDNEKWAYAVRLPPFALARRPVTQREFAAFVDEDGYRRADLWTRAGHAWLAQSGGAQPRYWRRVGMGWQQREFDRWLPLHGTAPMKHVSVYEAEAYCRWAGRRLPSEAEWEFAALNEAIAWGSSVWEWTSSPFEPYPGFAADAYRDYSEPWFNSHRSVRGGSHATTARIAHPKFRNFFEPHRSDIFIGFRTAAQ